jgi:two-component system, OmpR family, alkaline phosphatase synthesis response regulator PhoP
MSNKNYKILIVDDEDDIVEFINYNLMQEAYQTAIAKNGMDAINIAKIFKPNLILLDMNMPLKDGLKTCAELRNMSLFDDTSIVFLTAKGSEENEILALDSGADDFLRKPIKPSLLLSKIASILRRNASDNDDENILDFDEIKIFPQEYNVIYKNENIALARKEFKLLYMLASKPGRVFNRDEILNAIWGNEVIVGDRTIDVHIRKIRQKLDDKFIFTIKGVGYKFEA